MNQKTDYYGYSKTRLYRVWSSMIARCKYPNRRTYKDYGARGITVCDEWKDSLTFYKWALKNGYRDDLTIERIDVNKGYSPDNCTWITPKEQYKNRTDSERIMYNGELITLKEYADAIGVCPFTVYSRRNRGWTDEEILNIPYGRHGKKRGVAK
jgi:hypothetical protein